MQLLSKVKRPQRIIIYEYHALLAPYGILEIRLQQNLSFT
jgi:hypothetical protein